MNQLKAHHVVAKPVTVINPDVIGESLLGGPHADADWGNATVTLRLPIHETAGTRMQEVEVPLGVLAAVLERARWTHLEVMSGGPDDSV